MTGIIHYIVWHQHAEPIRCYLIHAAIVPNSSYWLFGADSMVTMELYYYCSSSMDLVLNLWANLLLAMVKSSTLCQYNETDDRLNGTNVELVRKATLSCTLRVSIVARKQQFPPPYATFSC